MAYSRNSGHKANTKANTGESTIIVCLGKGISKDGIMSKQSELDAAKAVELFKSGAASKILFSGGYSYSLGRVPKYCEAVEMAKFATRLGIKRKKIILETRSLDTMGNAIYSYEAIKKLNGIRNIILVCPKTQAERAEFLFGLTFTEYNIIQVDSGLAPEIKSKEREITKLEKIKMRSLTAQFKKFNGRGLSYSFIVKRINPLYATSEKWITEEAWKYFQSRGYTRQEVISSFIKRNKMMLEKTKGKNDRSHLPSPMYGSV